MNYDYGLFVIGAGPGGLAAAKQAAIYGVRVAIAEQNNLGGVCVNRGCVPKKLMVYASDFAAQFEAAKSYGWNLAFSNFDWQHFKAMREQEIERLRQVQERSLQQAGIHLIKGHARFLDAHTLEVEDRKITAERILIAVGGKPNRPKIPGIEFAITSREIFDQQQLPRRIAMLGGGYIGIEFASILHGLGAQVTVMDGSSRLLAGFDQDLQTIVQDGLTQRGIQILCNTTTQAISQVTEGLCLQLTGEGPETLVVDAILCATGRVPNLENLRLENADVEQHGKAIAVDRHSRTSQPHIYAIGDCTNRMQLTPVAKAEGKAFADTVYDDRPWTVNYDLVPSAVFARPEAAAVGLTEAQARKKHGDAIRCYCSEFEPLFHSLTPERQKSWIKLVVDDRTDRILGVHMVGEHAAEIVQSLTVALQKGATKQDFDSTIGIHPSSAEELFSI